MNLSDFNILASRFGQVLAGPEGGRLVAMGPPETIRVPSPMIAGVVEGVLWLMIIAFQLHQGPPMEVTFKDIVFKDLGKK